MCPPQEFLTQKYTSAKCNASKILNSIKVYHVCILSYVDGIYLSADVIRHLYLVCPISI